MSFQEISLDDDVEFYVPEFIWNFWLETWFVP